jgi:hypothetical protein
MWCRNRSQKAFLHRKSSLSHAQLDIEPYTLFASIGLKFGINLYMIITIRGKIGGDKN